MSSSTSFTSSSAHAARNSGYSIVPFLSASTRSNTTRMSSNALSIAGNFIAKVCRDLTAWTPGFRSQYSRSLRARVRSRGLGGLGPEPEDMQAPMVRRSVEDEAR